MGIHQVLCRLLLSMCLISIGFNISAATGYSPCKDQSLLLQLKGDLKFDPLYSKKLVLWNESTNCCEWTGVTCSEGRVVGLDLSEEVMTGGLDNSSSLFSLQCLESLNLAYNLFNTEIPSAFHKLRNLKHLNLSHAGFGGQIPMEISHLTNLVTLDLSCELWLLPLELLSPNLAMLIHNLSEITKLYLDGINLSSQRNEWCHAISSSLPKLQVLSLSSCYLQGPVDSSLLRLHSLSEIHLSRNNFSIPVPEFFCNFENLTVLDLRGSGFRGRFPNKIFQLKRLVFLDISYNRDIYGSLPEFPKNGSLQTLTVGNTNFSGQLPNSISNLGRLSRLDLQFCQFNGTVSNILSNLTELVYLDLSFNNFSGNMPALGMSKKLVYIDLDNNFFRGGIPSSLFMLPSVETIRLSNNQFDGQLSDISKASSSKLRQLDLSNNNLEGDIPLTVFELRELIFLQLSSNKFSGKIPAFGMSKKLVQIELQNNSFSGRVPSSLFMLPSVVILILSNNQFDGQLSDIPEASFSKLSMLHLNNNNLVGDIPLSVFELRQLTDLDLSSNKFSGNIDLNVIQKLRNLTDLDLSNNNLSIIDTTTTHSTFPSLRKLKMASCKLSKFPIFLRNQSSLKELDLSDNLIRGTIPHWISSVPKFNLSNNYLTDWEIFFDNYTSESGLVTIDVHSNNLQGPLPVLPQNAFYLDYSNNNFSSVIPKTICNASALWLLDLSSNSLTGTIPSCLIAMNGPLRVLNLRRNKLTGRIDPYPGSCHLESIDLNGNFLQGNIPKYLANCKMLKVLDLGNNQIDDKFPCWLKSIPTLGVLILRSNRLHGSLECPRTEVSWLNLQIFDIASNNFSGRIPPTFFENWKAMMANEKHKKPDYIEIAIYFEDISDYQASVTVTSKRVQMELVKIMTIFTSLDFSCNQFEGSLPEELGQLKALYILNFSNNALAGPIPRSFGNLGLVESLDLSCNKLSGMIPPQLASLTFLSFLNVSYNQLVGRIPTSTQLQSFPESSFMGNPGLCGPPLTTNCSHNGAQALSLPPYETHNSIDWNFLSAELGFTFGLGLVILPLIFYKRWRLWYWMHVDNFLYRVFPQLDFVYKQHGGKRYRTLRWRRY